MNNYNNSNNASTTISAWISASATTLLVDNGAILPNAPFLLTLEHMDNEKVTVREIVKCTAKIGNSLTIVRSAGICVQDDTATPKVQNNTPHSFWVGDFASIYWTSEQVKDIQDEINQKLNITDFQAWTYVYSSSSTETDAYSITIPWTITSYQLGQVFRFMADVENTWNATLNVNWIWAIEILKNHDQHLQSGDIEAWQIVEVAFDGTSFQMNSQIAKVVSLDDISSLSYNDLTCYAGEDIEENDLIITNWNSFDPERADEGVAVGDTDINKYAIWFIWNGESADTFSVKTSVNLWTEPDTVTINIESDDNWKPSGAVLATSSSLDIFKNPTDYSNPNILKNNYPSDVSYDTFLLPSVLNADLSNYQNAVWTMANGTITIKGTTYSISGNNKYLKWKSNDDRYYLFVANSSVSTEAQIVKIDGWNLEVIYNWDFWFVMGYASFAFNEDWTMFYIISPTWWTGNQTVYIYKLTTPYDFSSKIDETTFDMWSLNLSSAMDFYYYCRLHWQIITNELNEKKIFFTMKESNTRKTFCFSLDENGWITSYTSYSELPYPFTIWKRAYFWGVFDYSSRHPLLIKEGGLAFNYTPYHSKISLSLQTERHKKYRLTIAPERTWSVVNCAVIYDKEGEYYSEVAVKDMNNWSNVSDKTPYIDANCILARYALKSNLIDWENKIPRWFANGDYTNLSSVSYCFKWKKSGFQWLEQDTIYYSDNDWKITTNLWPCKVWQTTNDTDLIVNIDFGGKSFSKSYSWKFTDSFKVSCDWYIKYSFTLDHTTYSFVVWKTNVIDTKSANIWSTSTTVSLAYTFVPAWTTITLSTRDNNGTAVVSWTVEFLSAREN